MHGYTYGSVQERQSKSNTMHMYKAHVITILPNVQGNNIQCNGRKEETIIKENASQSHYCTGTTKAQP